MDPVTVSVTVGRPRQQVFEYLADIANHPEFCDHFLTDWRLTREDSYGTGAGARFKARQRLNRFPWGDTTFMEVEPPRRILQCGRGGKFNRIRTVGVWVLEPVGSGSTRVTLTWETDPVMLSDRLLEIGKRRWARRNFGKALRRLRAILEDGRERGARATVAGGPRKPASGFRFSSPPSTGPV
jgi:uncharacterized protein YndB with AHSA1/START domain